MRRRFSSSVWPSLGTKALVLAALTLISAATLAGCASPATQDETFLPSRSGYLPLRENDIWVNRTPTGKERALARSDFSMELLAFTDARRPLVGENDPTNGILYNYPPDELLQGVRTQVPAIMKAYLAYHPRVSKNYTVEVKLLRLESLVKSGTLFSGSWGRYYTNVEVSVLVRRADSTIALRRNYRLNRENRRVSVDGRSPSGEHDRNELFQLVDESLRKICETIGWDIRQGDAQDWDVTEPKTNPTVRISPAIVPPQDGVYPLLTD